MEETGKLNKAPHSILDKILMETFQKLDDNNNFDSELLLELRKLASEGSFQNDKLLTSILKGDL